MNTEVRALTVQLLEWISAQPRNYRQTMEAWRSTCPRLSIWEDAVIDGLVRVVDNGCAMDESAVVVTERGKAILGGK
jgi:hypothetical protein